MSIEEKVNDVVGHLKQIESAYSQAAFACSFGAEDMVLLDLIARKARRIEVFTIDTGRLPDETYALVDDVRNRYSVKVRVYFPDARLVEAWVEQNGANAFYRSVAQRKQCCHIRKVLPLQRALGGKASWLTGLRREQSAARKSLAHQEWDESNRLHKFSPLLDWTEDDVWTYLKLHDVPYNSLHDSGFPSIGCAPCTRAVSPGEDIRSGRWWWEQASTKECGLHAETKTPEKELTV